MENLSLSDSLLGLVLYVIPGYVAAATRDFLRVPQKKTDLERLASSVVLSLLVYLPLWQFPWFQETLGRLRHDSGGGMVLNADLLTFMSAVIAVGILWGVLAAQVSRRQRLWGVLYRFVAGRSPYRRVWDECLDLYPQRPVMVELCNGERYMGRVQSRSDDPAERDLFLEEPYYVPKSGRPVRTPAQGMLIMEKDVRYIAIL